MKAKQFVAREQSVGEFYEANRKDLERMATYILKRWKAPNDVGVEDVVQELLLACWRQRLKYRADRGATPEQYLSFNAISIAKRWVHKQRNARGDRDQGTFEVLTSSGDTKRDIVDLVDNAELDVLRKERLEELVAKCGSAREAICLFVLFEEEDTARAGDRIFKDLELRRLCRVNNVAAARQMVKQTLQEHACLG